MSLVAMLLFAWNSIVVSIHFRSPALLLIEKRLSTGGHLGAMRLLFAGKSKASIQGIPGDSRFVDAGCNCTVWMCYANVEHMDSKACNKNRYRHRKYYCEE